MSSQLETSPSPDPPHEEEANKEKDADKENSEPPICLPKKCEKFGGLEEIKELPEETDSQNRSQDQSINVVNERMKAVWTAQKRKNSEAITISAKRAKSYSLGGKDSEIRLTELTPEKHKKSESKKRTPAKKREDFDIKTLEVKRIVDPNYKAHDNYAIIMLTPESAKNFGVEYVATPLRPYSVDKVQRTASSQGLYGVLIDLDIKELLGQGMTLIAKTENIKKALQDAANKSAI